MNDLICNGDKDKEKCRMVWERCECMWVMRKREKRQEEKKKKMGGV